MSQVKVAAPRQQQLAQLIQDAQAILAVHNQPIGPSKAETISKLTELLAGDAAHAALAPAARGPSDTSFAPILYVTTFFIVVSCAVWIGQTQEYYGAQGRFEAPAGSCK